MATVIRSKWCGWCETERVYLSGALHNCKECQRLHEIDHPKIDVPTLASFHPEGEEAGKKELELRLLKNNGHHFSLMQFALGSAEGNLKYEDDLPFFDEDKFYKEGDFARFDVFNDPKLNGVYKLSEYHCWKRVGGRR